MFFSKLSSWSFPQLSFSNNKTTQATNIFCLFIFCSLFLPFCLLFSSPLVFVLRSYHQQGSPTLLSVWAFIPRFIFSSCPTVFSPITPLVLFHRFFVLGFFAYVKPEASASLLSVILFNSILWQIHMLIRGQIEFPHACTLQLSVLDMWEVLYNHVEHV